MLFWSESEYVTLFYCFFLFLIIFLGLLFASFFFGCFFVFGLIVSFSKILLKFLSFLFTIIFGLIFLLVLVLLFMFVLDYLWLDYYLDYLFVTPEGLQFDINNRLGEYLQSLNNSDTANEVTKNVSEGAGKDIKDVVEEKQSSGETYLDMLKDFYKTGHPVEVVSFTVAATCITLIIILKICGW